MNREKLKLARLLLIQQTAKTVSNEGLILISHRMACAVSLLARCHAIGYRLTNLGSISYKLCIILKLNGPAKKRRLMNGCCLAEGGSCWSPNLYSIPAEGPSSTPKHQCFPFPSQQSSTRRTTEWTKRAAADGRTRRATASCPSLV